MITTIEDVRGRVREIVESAGDDEMAHSLEDDLHEEVLEMIAQGRCPDAAEFAAAALETRKLKFARWCA